MFDTLSAVHYAMPQWLVAQQSMGQQMAMTTEKPTPPRLGRGKQKNSVEALNWTPQVAADQLGISLDKLRQLGQSGMLTELWPLGRGRGKPKRFDPEECRLYALCMFDDLLAYQRKMKRRKA